MIAGVRCPPSFTCMAMCTPYAVASAGDIVHTMSRTRTMHISAVLTSGCLSSKRCPRPIGSQVAHLTTTDQDYPRGGVWLSKEVREHAQNFIAN